MWSIGNLKSEAKRILNQNYWRAFIVCLIAMIPNVAINFHSRMLNFNFNGISDHTPYINNYAAIQNILITNIIFIIIAVFVLLITLAVTVFLTSPLKVGMSRYFISAAGGVDDMGFVGFAFKESRYLNVIKTMFIKQIIIEVMFLLFIIPGIWKSLQYAFVPYILADNPKIHYKRALDISKKLSYGNKWHMLMLGMSFAGWYVLGALVCGVGILFVEPYYQATFANLYITLRNQALTDAAFAPEEFSMTLKLPDSAEHNDSSPETTVDYMQEPPREDENS